MNYILMHKEIPVVEMALDEATGAVQKIGNVYHLEHLPIGILMKKNSIGDVLLGKAIKTDGFDFRSPDNTSDGFLKKRWKIIDGKRCLLKAGSAPFMQQPFNEVIATAVRPLAMTNLPAPSLPAEEWSASPLSEPMRSS